jgi:hypothetical protein
MTQLSLQVSLQPDETIMSFVSRLAAKNGPSFVQDFCLDMGLHWLKLVHSDEPVISRLANLVGKCPKILAGRALAKIDRRRCLLSGQLLAARTYVRTEQKVCPKCMVQDEEDQGRYGPHGRKQWLLSSFRVCPMHQCHLLVLPKAEFPMNQYDFYRRYAASRKTVFRAASELHGNYQTAWECYLQRRLQGKTGSSWIDQFDLDAAMRIVQSLGIIIAFGPSVREAELSFLQLSDASIAGFCAVSGNEEQLLEALDDVRLRSDSRVPGFRVDFGMFARWCTRICKEDRYAPLIDVVTKFAFENYPMAKDEYLYDRACPRRHLHNCASAAEAYGISGSRMLRLIEGLKLGEKMLGKPRIFSTKESDVVVPDVCRCITRIEAIRRLGTHPDRFDSLVSSGAFAPKYALPQMAELFDPQDIDGFLNRLQYNAILVEKPTKSGLTLKSVCNAAVCHAEDVLGKLSSGKLKSVERISSLSGITAFRFDLEEILDVFEGLPSNDLSKAQLRSVLCVNCTTVKMLIDSMQLKASNIRHHRSRRSMKVVCQAEVDRYLATYVSLGELAKKEGIQANWVAARLAKEGIHPINLPDKYSKLYLRRYIEA